MAKTTPWTKIKAEYLQGVTPKDLAKKYGLTSQQVRSKASKEKWGVDKVTIINNVTQNTQDRIESLTNNALEVLSEVMNSPSAEDKDKVSAARAILDVSGLKSIKQEVKANVKSELRTPKWNKKMSEQVMKDFRELVDE